MRFAESNTLTDYCLVGTNICNTAVVVQRAVLYGWSDSASRPAVYVFIQSAGSMRSPSFHFAMRSKRANKPTPGDPRVHSGTDASSVIKSPSFGPLGVIT